MGNIRRNGLWTLAEAYPSTALRLSSSFTLNNRLLSYGRQVEIWMYITTRITIIITVPSDEGKCGHLISQDITEAPRYGTRCQGITQFCLPPTPLSTNRKLSSLLKLVVWRAGSKRRFVNKGSHGYISGL